jgi:hypothetical protein
MFSEYASSKFNGLERYFGRCPELFNASLAYIGTSLVTHLANNFITYDYLIRINFSYTWTSTEIYEISGVFTFNPSSTSPCTLNVGYAATSVNKTFAYSKAALDANYDPTDSSLISILGSFYNPTDSIGTVINITGAGTYTQSFNISGKTFSVVITISAQGRITAFAINTPSDPQITNFQKIYTVALGLLT